MSRAAQRLTDEALLAILSGAKRQGDRYEFRSSRTDDVYYTTAISCTCPHWQFRNTACRHMRAVALDCPPVALPKGFEGDPFDFSFRA